MNKPNFADQKAASVRKAGYRLLNFLCVHFLERLLFLGVAIVLPLKLAGAGEMSMAQTGLYYSYILFMYRCTPLLFSYLSLFIRREFIFTAGVIVEATSLLLMAYSQDPQAVYGFALLAGIGGGATTTMLISLLESADRDAKSLVGNNINHDIFNTHLMLINASAFICPFFAFFSIGIYQGVVTFIILVLLALVVNFFRLGKVSSPEYNIAMFEKRPEFDKKFFLIWTAALSVWAACSIVYTILPSLDSHFLGQEGVNIWLSFDAIVVVLLFFLLRHTDIFRQNSICNASIGLIAILAALLFIVLSMHNFYILLFSLAVLAFGGYIAFGQLYGLAMQTRFIQRKTFYLGLLSLSGALGEGGTQAIFWLTENAGLSLVITFGIVLIGLFALHHLDHN
ncbi:MFS transporter [Acerihabitans arboris]|uniref:MFS transporter n=1 Tax=Acerihabitans arboris TaxID=2691583 RepID=A0A845SQA1_9GAMM|nr:MFS transporter [Acerihabitans arboris]NDL64748.1 hypothetical protein [Acerihabitans arboris]